MAATVSILEGTSENGNWVATLTGIAGNTLSGISSTSEANGILGTFSFQFEYLSTTTPVPAAGSSSTTNYNIFEPTAPLTLSDTLHVVVTWRTPTTQDPNNVIVNMTFVSDSLDEIPPPPLTDAFTVFETGQEQTVQNPFGVSDLTVSFRSDLEATPIPAALPLFATGLGALGLLGRRRKRKQAA